MIVSSLGSASTSCARRFFVPSYGRRRRPRGFSSSSRNSPAAAINNGATNSTIRPVVIVGGGPVGLLLAHLLRTFAVPSILLERQSVASRFRHPQAHFLNTRSMEILKHGCLPRRPSSSTSSSIYKRVCAAMPPVSHWQDFRFGTSMVTSREQQPLAVVRHPVDRPLQAGTDANGVLLGLDESSSRQHQQNKYDLSPCSVGHLAQHTFGRILYDAAVQQSQNDDDGLVTIRYETGVKSVEVPPQSGPVIVTTETGETYETDLCVAADGAHSLIRRQLGIPRQGQEALQHLMNIHVRLTPHQAEKLHANNNHAMLYSVYSERVVAMVVCHSIGEYIVQIPFFPPYQTPEEDFGPEQLPLLLRALFGEAAAADCQVLSSKPWTMSSLVANRYFVANDAADSAVLLAGDAAHVFPPAGGFGMNTGLQDAHNLAWKIATYRSRQQQRASHQHDLRELLQSYEQERRPIAQQNAALSIRNYRRLLEVTKQLYLNEQHPALLTKMLDNSPLPLPARQAIFRSLLQTALYPLSWLNKNEDSLYQRHIQSNLRQILKTGAGLPLLFPKFEIGFCYDSMKKKGENNHDNGSSSGPPSPSLPENDWRSDTWANSPRLEVGGLLPHVKLQVLAGSERFPRLQLISKSNSNNNPTISATDLAMQMMRGTDPTYVLLCVPEAGARVNQERTATATSASAIEVCRAKEKEIGLPVELAIVLRGDVQDGGASRNEQSNSTALTVCEPLGLPFSFSGFREEAYSVLIRPDGHISEIMMH